MKVKAEVYLLVLNCQKITTKKIFKYLEFENPAEVHNALRDLNGWEIEDVGNAWIPGTTPRFHPFDFLQPKDCDKIADTILGAKK
jgi:hypothetical protein